MIDELISERLKKLEVIKEAGIDPYPARIKRTHSINSLKEKFDLFAKSQRLVSVAGRIMSIRDQGNIVFVDLRDESGSIQAVIKKENISNLAWWKSVLDRGDFIWVEGPLFKTKKGEESVDVLSFGMASKSVRPLPSTWYGVEDIETRLRERYLDIFLNTETADIFRKKAVFWKTIRAFLSKEGFLEVEAPVLESIPGGAEAEPFITHHNALNADFYLRISLELPLKKMIVGGYEKVFEIGRIFRNEGIDREHLQDYTQAEFYWGYTDYNDMMRLTEKLYKKVIKEVTGGLETEYAGKKIDWSGKWKNFEYCDLFKDAIGLDARTASLDDFLEKAKSLKLSPEKGIGKGRLIDLIFKKTVRPTLVSPGFLINPPVLIEPLAKRMPNDPERVERFQIVASGTELGKGFSELNDPLDQRARFEEQMELREAGDKEAQQLDEDYLRAMEYGMPPMSGFGLSERLFSFLMDKPMRETVIFPLMRKSNR